MHIVSPSRTKGILLHIVSKTSAKDQLIPWKHDTTGIFNFLKNFLGFVYLFTKLIACDHE